jgi:CIC family chloride channel protein
LLMMGGALGAMASGVLPGHDRALWPLVSMAAALGGTMRSPLTAVIFALELTHDINTLPALLLAAVVAHGFTVLVMKRSILTEKVARRGYHISREYSVDPLESLRVGEVMSTEIVSIPAGLPVREVLSQYFFSTNHRKHPGYPVVNKEGKLLGVITRSNLLEHWISALIGGDPNAHLSKMGPIIAYDLVGREPVTAYPEESCRTAVERMARSGVKRLPVVNLEEPAKMIGIVTLSDLLKARQRLLEEEAKRERFFGLGLARPALRPD